MNKEMTTVEKLQSILRRSYHGIDAKLFEQEEWQTLTLRQLGLVSSFLANFKHHVCIEFKLEPSNTLISLTDTVAGLAERIDEHKSNIK